MNFFKKLSIPFLLSFTLIFTECKKEAITDVNYSEIKTPEQLLDSPNDPINENMYYVKDFNFHLDGVPVAYETIDSLFDNILYSDFPDTLNVFCFTNLAAFDDYLTGNPNKADVLKDINDMDSIAALIPDSLDDEMKSPVKVIPGQIALLNGSYSISGFDMPTPTTNGDGFTSWTPKLNLGSMNNRVTGITFWAITGSFSVWCTKKNFKGMKNFYWGFPFFGGRYILTDVRWNNNFMSVY